MGFIAHISQVRYLAVLFIGCACSITLAGELQSLATPAIASRSLDDEHGFRILVWQYRTNARKDFKLYQRVHLSSWHIDYGEGRAADAKWSTQMQWPYYVDHAAGKGILHLTSRSGLDRIARDGSPATRPWSLFDETTLEELESRLKRNIPPVAFGPALAIALDDEVSLGHFNSPLEVDHSQAALAAFQRWLPTRYRESAQLQNAWDLPADGPFDPVTFEGVRAQINKQPPAQWRLAPWLDYRSFMDRKQAEVFAQLTLKSNHLAPQVPTGIVGAQQPSVYGGFDYSLLKDSVQWMEAYDIGGTNEILRSFWSEAPRRGRMQTYFLTGNARADKWFLWYYLAHGCRSVIAWPDIGGSAWFQNGKIDQRVEQLAETFQQVQAPALNVLAHPETEPIFSPIAVLYSHPSVQVGWAIDASTHGKTWPKRSSSLDNSCLSSGKNRVAWLRLLEDLGYQARIVDPSDLVSGLLAQKGIKVLVLPQSFALSQKECEAILEFASQGGCVISDYGTAVTDEHGTGYDKSPLDPLFGIDRSQDEGWFDGVVRYELNGELYQQPFVNRFIKKGTLDDHSLTVVERCLKTTTHKTRYGRGRPLFLNASPTIYFDNEIRAGQQGRFWRQLIETWLEDCGIIPAVKLKMLDGKDHGVELLRYRSSQGTEIWVVVANPTRQASVDGPGKGLRIDSSSISLRIEPPDSVQQLKNLRTGELTGFEFKLPPGEAMIFEVIKTAE